MVKTLGSGEACDSRAMSFKAVANYHSNKKPQLTFHGIKI
jgi:hypothetical protein